MKMIEIKNLTFKYDKNTILDNVNLEITSSQMIGIVGPNGCGKTTLLKLLVGLLPSNDSIITEYSYVNSEKIEYNLNLFGMYFSEMDDNFICEEVIEELSFPLFNLGYKKEEVEEIIICLAKDLDVCELLDKRVESLSNEEKRIVLFMLSVIHKPKIVILDNVFSCVKNKIKYINYLKKLKDKNTTIVLATNNLEELYDFDYIYFFNKGNLVMEGEPYSVFNEEKILNNLKLEIPFMVDLSLKLKFYDLLKDIELDMDRMIDILWK